MYPADWLPPARHYPSDASARARATRLSDRAEIHDLLVELRRDKIAVLLVSHALASLGDVTDDALVVAEGQVERGSCEELLAPANLDRLFGAAKA